MPEFLDPSITKYLKEKREREKKEQAERADKLETARAYDDISEGSRLMTSVYGEVPERSGPGGAYREELDRQKRASSGAGLDPMVTQYLKQQRAGEKEDADKKVKDRDMTWKMGQAWNKDHTTKETAIMDASFDKIKESLESGSAVGDTAVIFAFMKMLDPGSVVREGEQQLFLRADGILNKLGLGYLSDVLYGNAKLTEPQKQKVAEVASRYHAAQLRAQERVDNQYRTNAEQFGLDADMVVPKGRFVPKSYTYQLKDEQGGEGSPTDEPKDDGNFADQIMSGLNELKNMLPGQATGTEQPPKSEATGSKYSDDDIQKKWQDLQNQGVTRQDLIDAIQRKKRNAN